MESEEITIRLSADQALVLSDWLHRMEQSDQLIVLIKERAVVSALWRIERTLEATLVEMRTRRNPPRAAPIAVTADHPIPYLIDSTPTTDYAWQLYGAILYGPPVGCTRLTSASLRASGYLSCRW